MLAPAEALALTVEHFLAQAPTGIVLENGTPVFDLALSKYSISGAYNICPPHSAVDRSNVVGHVARGYCLSPDIDGYSY